MKQLEGANLPKGIEVYETDAKNWDGAPMKAVVRNNRVIGTVTETKIQREKGIPGSRLVERRWHVRGHEYRMTGDTVKQLNEWRDRKLEPRNTRYSEPGAAHNAVRGLIESVGGYVEHAPHFKEPEKLDLSGPMVDVDKTIGKAAQLDASRPGSDEDVEKYRQKLREKGITDPERVERLAQAAARTDRQNRERDAMSREERIFGGGGERPGASAPKPVGTKADPAAAERTLRNALASSKSPEVRAAIRAQLDELLKKQGGTAEPHAKTLADIQERMGAMTPEQRVASVAPPSSTSRVEAPEAPSQAEREVSKDIQRQRVAIERTEAALARAKPGGAIAQRMQARLDEQRRELAAMSGSVSAPSARPTTEVPTTTGTPKADPAMIRRQEVAIERTIAARDRAKPGGAIHERMEARLREQREELARMQGKA